MVSERRERAQVILIGAIALAFILLGIVVVFNGVLYTETLSSSGASQSAADADLVELEVERGVGCSLYWVDEAGGDSTDAEENITEFGESYRNTTIESMPTAVSITNVNASSSRNATVTIVYDSADFHYEQTKTITADDCPSASTP